MKCQGFAMHFDSSCHSSMCSSPFDCHNILNEKKTQSETAVPHYGCIRSAPHGEIDCCIWLFCSRDSIHPNRTFGYLHMKTANRISLWCCFLSSFHFVPTPFCEWSQAHMNFLFDAVRFSVWCQTERNHKQKWSNTENASEKKTSEHQTVTWSVRQVDKPKILNKTAEKRFELRSHQMQIKANRKAICQIGGGFSCRIWCFSSFHFGVDLFSVCVLCALS